MEAKKKTGVLVFLKVNVGKKYGNKYRFGAVANDVLDVCFSSYSS